MRRYKVLLITYAQELYDSYTPDVRAAVDQKIEELAVDPYRDADYNRSDATWSSRFGNGDGIVLYYVSENIVRVTVLRLTWGG